MESNKEFDVIIIGGSYSGMSAAMALGRSLRKVLIIDNNLPCNRQTPHTHNFLTQDGETPASIADRAKARVLKYSTVEFLNVLAVSGKINENSFTITTETNEQFKSRKLIIASGIKDIFPDIKGFNACWGISVIHCPYCHGYEFRNRKTAILATGKRAFHLATLVNNLTNDLTIITSTKSDFDSEEMSKLKKHNIKITDKKVVEIEHQSGHIRYAIFDDGSRLPLDALYAAVPFVQHSEISTSLGCELTEEGLIKVNNFQASTINGIYACGDNSSMMRSVANAVYTGNLAGAMVNSDLCNELFNKQMIL